MGREWEEKWRKSYEPSVTAGGLVISRSLQLADVLCVDVLPPTRVELSWG